jgi:hypothetical protein
MDAYVSKFDAAGNPQWARQIGSSQWERGWGIAADGLGNVYVSGSTEGNLGGTPNANSDAFLVKYDASGNHLWTRQFGTSQHDNGRGVAIDSNGNVYVTGSTFGNLDGVNAGLLDTFVRKYDPMGHS